MPSFVWKGKNRFGAFQEGILIADTREEVARILIGAMRDAAAAQA